MIRSHLRRERIRSSLRHCLRQLLLVTVVPGGACSIKGFAFGLLGVPAAVKPGACALHAVLTRGPSVRRAVGTCAVVASASCVVLCLGCQSSFALTHSVAPACRLQSVRVVRQWTPALRVATVVAVRAPRLCVLHSVCSWPQQGAKHRGWWLIPRGLLRGIPAAAVVSTPPWWYPFHLGHSSPPWPWSFCRQVALIMLPRSRSGARQESDTFTPAEGKDTFLPQRRAGPAGE